MQEPISSSSPSSIRSFKDGRGISRTRNTISWVSVIFIALSIGGSHPKQCQALLSDACIRRTHLPATQSIVKDSYPSVYTPRPPSSRLQLDKTSREDEIKRKIMKLKREGKIKSQQPTSEVSYEDKIKERLGSRKSKLLGFDSNDDSRQDDDEIARIQSELDDDTEDLELDAEEFQAAMNNVEEKEDDDRPRLIDPSLFDNQEIDDAPELSEDELVELVAEKMKDQTREERLPQSLQVPTVPLVTEADTIPEKTTSGVGGSWQKPKDDTEEEGDLYKPKSGSWGAFPRPRDISKTYGGGRRVGAGFSKEDDAASDMKTKELLKEYRRKVGIDVPSEKEHAKEIEEALNIAQLAMQRGIYATAVSALEKVTKWCSTNSKVGSKVFLELAMAYEAVGRTAEAYQVYKTLSTCRMEDVKYNAKRLLYGLEAMEFMKDVSSDFSRQKVKNTFVDATGLRDIAQNFDDVYQTAYIDLEGSFYKQLTQSVVRSNREARQILLKATGKGEVGRMKIVQALRSLARHFDDSLEAEIAAQKQAEATVFIDGKPLMRPQDYAANAKEAGSDGLDDFVLASPEQMWENLEGTWNLQLLADKKGDGVTFFNTTTAVQTISTTSDSLEGGSFDANGPLGLITVQRSGKVELAAEDRQLLRSDLVEENGPMNIMASLFGGSSADAIGFPGAVTRVQQVVLVDSVLMVTKSPPKSRTGKNADKDHFAVWRRVVEDT